MWRLLVEESAAVLTIPTSPSVGLQHVQVELSRDNQACTLHTGPLSAPFP